MSKFIEIVDGRFVNPDMISRIETRKISAYYQKYVIMLIVFTDGTQANYKVSEDVYRQIKSQLQGE